MMPRELDACVPRIRPEVDGTSRTFKFAVVRTVSPMENVVDGGVLVAVGGVEVATGGVLVAIGGVEVAPIIFSVENESTSAVDKFPAASFEETAK